MSVAQRKPPGDGPGDDSTPDDVTPADDGTTEAAAAEGATAPAAGEAASGTPADDGEAGGTPAAAPLDPPAVRARRPVPPPLAAEPAAAIRDIGGGHVAIVGHDGNVLGPDDLFTDPGGHATYVVAAQRIYQQFRYPNTRDPGTQLLYALGVRVPRDQAEQLRRTAGHEAAAEAGTG